MKRLILLLMLVVVCNISCKKQAKIGSKSPDFFFSDPNLKIKRIDSIMAFCAKIPDTTYLELAIKHGGNVNLVNRRTETIIFDAIMHGNRKAIKILINSGANINFQDASGRTPMALAAALNYYDIVFLLLEHGADPFLKNNTGGTIAYPIELSYETMLRSGPLFQDLLKVIKELKKRGMKLNLKESRKYRGKWKDGVKL